MKEFALKFKDLDEVHQLQSLRELISTTDEKIIIEFVKEKIKAPNVGLIWHKLLRGLANANELVRKRFKIVFASLDLMRTVEINIKTSCDLINRLNTELPTFTPEQLVELSDFCLESMRAGDPKWCGWKDLFPPVIKILSNISNIFHFNDIEVTGVQFHNKIIDNICTMKWEKSILSATTSMFRNITLSKDTKSIIIAKISKVLQDADPDTLASLAPELFALSDSDPWIFLSIFAFEKYFYKNVYKKLYAENETDSTNFDSIEPITEGDIRHSENTILYHLGSFAQFKITEKQIVDYYKTLEYTPNYILTPFIISSLLVMSKIDNESEKLRLSTSLIFPFLRNVIRNFYYDMDLAKESLWCRQNLDSLKTVNLETMFNVLIDNCETTIDSITPGMVYMSMSLLKAKKHDTLNKLGSHLLQKIAQKKPIYISGIVKHLAELIFADQEAVQYSECLTLICKKHPKSAAENKNTISNILENFLCIDGRHAMRLMTFVFPLIRMSDTIRNDFIAILRRAMTESDIWTRKMGIYGFCMILKLSRANMGHLNSSLAMTQSMNLLSGFSIQTLATQSSNRPSATSFDIMTLEVLGVLRQCFNQSSEIKELMYENLSRAVQYKPGLLPHILQFIDWHFHSYFNVDELTMEINFDSIVGSEGSSSAVVNDHLGKLLAFVCNCIVQCDKNEIICNNLGFKKLLESLLRRINTLSLDQMGIIGTLDVRTSVIGMQFLNCMEALMEYGISAATPENFYIRNILSLFKHHHECLEELTKMVNSKKNSKRAVNKNANATETNVITQVTQTATTKDVSFKPENIWDLSTVQSFLALIHCDNFNSLPAEHTHSLRTNREFGRYILRVATNKIEGLRKQHEYCLVKHSARLFKNLCECTKIVYTNCIVRIEELCGSFDVETAHLCIEYFKQSLITVDSIYAEKIEAFLKTLVRSNDSEPPLQLIIKNIQCLIEKSMTEESIIGLSDSHGDKNKLWLFECLEILYSHLCEEEIEEAYDWIFNFCKTNAIESKTLGIVHKILFQMHYKTRTGKFFNSIAMQIVDIYEPLNSDFEINADFTLMSLTIATVDNCVLTLCGTIKNQLHNIEHYVLKVNSLHIKIKTFQQKEKSHCVETLFSLESAMSAELITILSTLEILVNAHLPSSVLPTVFQILRQTYVCLTNFVKYFIKRHGTLSVSKNDASLDKLIRATKKMAKPVYDMMTYISKQNSENNIEEQSNNKNKNQQIVNAKVIRQMKLLANLVFNIESFNKFVIILGDKTKSNLASYLHIGVGRDFNIKTATLVNAMNDDNLDYDIQEMSDVVDEEIRNISPATISPNTLPAYIESDISEEQKVMLNLDIVNKKAKKRKKLEKSHETEETEITELKIRKRSSRNSLKNLMKMK